MAVIEEHVLPAQDEKGIVDTATPVYLDAASDDSGTEADWTDDEENRIVRK
jgi:hypothetical protein